MSWTVLPPQQPKQQNVLQSLLGGLVQGGSNAVQQLAAEKKEKEQSNKTRELFKSLGVDTRGETNPQILKTILENHFEQKKGEKTQEQAKEAAEKAGYTPGVPPAVAAQQVKQKAKDERLKGYGLNLSPLKSPQTNGQDQEPQNSSPFSKLTDEQLIQLQGAEDREISEPAKATLQSRQEQRKVDVRTQDQWSKFDRARAEKALQEADEIGSILPQKQSALDIAKDAISSKDMGMFSWDNIAEVTGLEGLRSKEGAIFKTAMKEFLLGSIARAGARPNQWIEQQIADMAPKVGRSMAANLSVERAMQNEIDLEKEKKRITYDIYNDLRNNDKNVGELPTLRNRHMEKFASAKQNELLNDLRAIKSIDENKPEKFHKVAPGTIPSKEISKALLLKFNNDPEKVFTELERLGYQLDE